MHIVFWSDEYVLRLWIQCALLCTQLVMTHGACIDTVGDLEKTEGEMSRPPRRFASVLAWLEHERSTRVGIDAAGRKKLSLLRTAGNGNPPVRLRAGKTRKESAIGSKSHARQRRRWRVIARGLLPQISKQLIRLRVVAKDRLVKASDVRRALRFGSAFKRVTKDTTCTVVALLYERCWRDPQLSAYLLSRQAANRRRHRSVMEATWKSVRETRAKTSARGADHRFWSGPAALNASQAPWAWDEAEVLGKVKSLLASRRCVDAAAHVAEMSQLPFVSRYFAFGFLRELHAGGFIHLREAADTAATMSDNVEAGASICPLPIWRRALVSSGGRTSQNFQYGDMALVACETLKSLQALGFCIGSGAVTPGRDPLQELGNGAGHMLLQFLEQCEPLHLHEVQAVSGVRSTEASLVDRFLPQTAKAWDASPHWCRGSESLTPLLLPQMQRWGFLVERTPSANDH